MPGKLHLHEEGFQVLKLVIWPRDYVPSSRRMKVGIAQGYVLGHVGLEQGKRDSYSSQSQGKISGVLDISQLHSSSRSAPLAAQLTCPHFPFLLQRGDVIIIFSLYVGNGLALNQNLIGSDSYNATYLPF